MNPAPPDAMQARYHITEQDYVRAGRLFTRPSARLGWAIAVTPLLLLALLLWGSTTLRGAALALLIWAALCVLLLTVINPWLLRRHYRKYLAMHDEQQIRLLDSGLHLSSVDGEVRLPWGKILKWRHNPDYLLVYPMPRLYYIVPTHVARQGFDVQALKDALTRHVGPAR